MDPARDPPPDRGVCLNMLPPPRPRLPFSPRATRRTAFKLGLIGLAGAGARLSAADGGGGFTHGVASGEPGPRQVLLWTRYAAAGESTLTWELSEDLGFVRIAASGQALASPDHDGCAKAWARGLTPGRWYYYRFIAPSGEVSLTGRTRTLPEGKVAGFRIALFSCANYGFGWFNAYAHAAEAGDFDLAVHVGDYVYEYQRGEYPGAREQAPARAVLPVGETVALADYRARYAQYRADPDLQRLHQIAPMVAMWDDHETANDTWQDGAENHQPDKEGDWQLRKAASERAWREWMPVSDEYWASYEIGDLATLLRLESRHVARTRPLDFRTAFAAAAPGAGAAALAEFRDGTWRDPAHTLLGAAQEAWLAAVLKRSVKARKPWQVIAQQVVMGSLALPDEVLEGLPAKAPEWLRQRLDAAIAAAHAGIPFNMDAWDGYPAARDRLTQAALNAGADLVVLSGDSHNAWACNLDHAGHRVGTEIASHSVTSPGAEGTLPWLKPDALARAMAARNPQLAWCDTAQRGYVAIELTARAVTSEWRFLAGVRERGTALAGVKRMTVLAGQRRYSA